MILRFSENKLATFHRSFGFGLSLFINETCFEILLW